MRTTLCLLGVTVTCLRCIAQNGNSASIEGVVMAGPGDPIAGAKVELHSRTQTFGGETERMGHYQVDGISAGEYKFQVRSAGFKTYEIKSVQIAEGEQLRMPDTELDVAAMCGRTSRESIRMLSGIPGVGILKSSVYPLWPPFSPIIVTLVCGGGRVCGSTRTSWTGKFEFRDLTSGWYDLKISRKGFYPLEELHLPVTSGLEQVYFPRWLDKCRNGNCDPKLRPIKICE